MERVKWQLCRETSRDGDQSDDGPDDPDFSRRGGFGTDSSERVRTWLGNLEDEDDAADPHDPMEIWNLDDENVDEDQLPELSVYHRALIQSSAYRWLVETLRRERDSMVPGKSDARASMRDQIIDALGRPKRVSRKDRQEVQAVFYSNWDPFTFWKDQQYESPLRDVLARAVTLTGYRNSVEAVTCLQYMRQTWPETGPALLDLLQSGIDRRSGIRWDGKAFELPHIPSFIHND